MPRSWFAPLAVSLSACAPAPAPERSPEEAPSATLAAPAPTPSTVASAGSAAPPAARAPDPPPPEVRAAADAGMKELQQVEPGTLLSRGERRCEPATACHWQFPLMAASATSEDSPVGWILVADGTVELHYRANDGSSTVHTIAGYVQQRKTSERVAEMALRSKDVQQLCAETKAQGAPCVVFVDQPGQGACPKKPSLEDACLWSVYVGANMGSHSSRLATLYVDPVTGSIVSASDLACPPMPLSGWRARRADKSNKLGDTCPGAKLPVSEPLTGTSAIGDGVFPAPGGAV